MIRVLINIPNSKVWVGGLNYFSNLVKAVQLLPESQIKFYILKKEGEIPSPFKELPTVTPPWLLARTDHFITRVIRKINRDIFKLDPLAKTLQAANIDIFSHGSYLGKRSKVKSLAWIPDFQHKHLPLYFSQDEINRRDISYQIIADNGVPLILSSHDALADFNKFYPKHRCKTYVLQFACLPPKEISEDERSKVLRKFDIHEPFFHIPNQLWAHKNHKIVIEALKILKYKGKCPLVISTGLTEDYRNPEYFNELKKICSDNHLEGNMRFLGLIEYSEVATLMTESVALINPSLFEGWSTTVEESKSLGKSILLSNIAVHLEQAPERGKFFSPHSADELANLMEQTMAAYDPKLEYKYKEESQVDLDIRFMKFAQAYEEIILDVVKSV